MAFARQSVTTSAPSNANENWKAQGFINLYLPTKGGKRRKLGAVALREAKDNEKALYDWLNADPENVSKLASKLIVEFQTASITEGAAFDLD